MESETYLNQREHEQTLVLIVSGFPYKDYKELGVQWIPERGQYQIVNKKLWFLARIKYGI